MIASGARVTGPTDFPEAAVESSLGARFDEMALRFPDHTAVQTPGAHRTYADLHRLANRIAHRLIADSAALEEPVAVLLESGDTLIAAILGALKAGKLVVPLDPSYPEDRLAVMLADSGARSMLSNSQNRDLAVRILGRADGVIDLGSLPADLSEQNPRRAVPPTTLAYLLYSSGSTGKPKGIVHSHRNALQNIRNYSHALRIGPTDRVIMLHSASFSSGVNDVLFTLLNGAALLPWDIKVSGLDPLLSWLAKRRVTILNWSPTTYRHLLETLGPDGRLPSIRAVVLGSEPVTRRDWELYCRHFGPDCVFIHRLGSTECNNYRFNFLNQKSAVAPGLIPAGYAVPDKEVLLLDEAGQPVLPGEIGQIAVRSDYLSPGYWKRPDLTAAVFRLDPAGSGRRIYLTGDFGRMPPDGCLEYLGRKDSQLKFHGVRIEASEIELALTAHPGIRDAVATVHTDDQGHQCLVAYIVPRHSPAPAPGELHATLSAKLPPSMVPSAFVVLETLPMTPSGKVDRRALPAPVSRCVDLSSYEPAKSATEETLAAIWADVLRRDRVGRNDHFFNLGGQSLTAVRMLARTRAALRVEVPLKALFAAPTLAGFASHVEAIAKRDAKNGTAALDAGEVASIPLRREGQRLALTTTQEQLRFLQSLEPENPAYNIPVLVRFSGQLDRAVLGRALAELVERHEILRSVIAGSDYGGEHVIRPPSGWNLPLLDLTRLLPREREPAARVHVAQEAARPFDLAAGPLLRTQLIRLDVDRHWLILNVHHIIFDGASTGIFLDELAGLYSALLDGRPSPLPAQRHQFADLALWQRTHVDTEKSAGDLAFWKQHLADAPEQLDLPVDKPRSAARSHAGGCFNFKLPPVRLERLKALGREEESTAFMVLLAVYQILLSRYARQEDICVGTPVAGRARAEAERLLGYFANMVVLRGNLAGNPTFREFVRRSRAAALDAFAHQETPLEHIVAALNPHRGLRQSPLFQAALVFNQETLLRSRFSGLEATSEPIHNGAAKFDLTLTVRERPDGLNCSLEYRSDLFVADSIQRMAAHFSHLLEQALDCPDAQIGSLDLISVPERQKLLFRWNSTVLDYSRDKCVHDLFERQAEKTPESVALVAGTERLTYRQLETRANQLAHHLGTLGVGPDSLVAIFMERSVEMVVGLLAVLKAGGAYVPLDPSYPKERSAFIVEDAGATVLLTQSRLTSRLPAHRAQIVLVDALENSDHAPRRPHTGVEPGNLAYVIFTSGSTGRPKGVAIEHRSAVAFAAWARSVFSTEELAGVLFSTSICFDLSVFELFVTLSSGGKVILAENALQLPDLPAVAEVTLVNTVPSAIAELVRHRPLPAGVRTVNLAGEPLPTSLVDRVYESPSVQKVYDLYGPSEDTTYSTFALRTPGGVATIGRPIANTQGYILDARLKPVPVGVPGELFLGGAGLARGYLNRPELTAEKFIPNPFGAVSEGRLYRTGDLCRYLPDGNIEFLGRIDHQLKIRGFRIELGEIESVLREVAGVREAAVVAREDTPGEKRLVAYLVPSDESAAIVIERARSTLRRKLPEYMLPTAIVALEKLPLSPNGKLDRRALPVPDPAGHPSGRTPVQPRTPTEKKVAHVWAAVLGLDAVSIVDNFFDLGGHSLLAARLASELEKLGGRPVPISILFHAPTVESMARLLDHQSAPPAFRSLVPLQRNGTERPLFCVHGWGGDVFGFVDLAHALAPHQPVYGLQAVGLDGRRPRHESVEEMAALYASEIRMVQPEGPYHLTGYSLGGWIAYAVAQELHRQGQQVALLGLLDTRATSDVPWGIYLRGVLPYIVKRVGLHFHRYVHGPKTGRLPYLRHLLRSATRHLRLKVLWQQITRSNSRAAAALSTRGTHASHGADNMGDHYNAAAARYRPEKYRGDIDLFVGDDIKGLMYAFWHHLATGHVAVHRVSGTHHSLLGKDHLEGLATALKRVLNGIPARRLGKAKQK